MLTGFASRFRRWRMGCLYPRGLRACGAGPGFVALPRWGIFTAAATFFAGPALTELYWSQAGRLIHHPHKGDGAFLGGGGSGLAGSLMHHRRKAGGVWLFKRGDGFPLGRKYG